MWVFSGVRDLVSLRAVNVARRERTSRRISHGMREATDGNYHQNSLNLNSIKQQRMLCGESKVGENLTSNVAEETFA